MALPIGCGEKKYKHLTSNGWKALSPGSRARTVMKAKCGTKCFLGPKNEKCFPICEKGTCKINKKGLVAAYIRAHQQSSIKSKSQRRTKGPKKTKKGRRKTHNHTKKLYDSIASRAKKMLNQIGYTVGVN